MKWIHRLIGLLIVAAAVGVSLIILLPAFQGGGVWSEFIAGVETRRILVIAVCIGVVLAVTAYVLTGISSSSRVTYLSYETQYGNISISIKALQDFLGHLKTEFPAILALTPRVRVLDESLDVTLEIRVRAGAPIPEICRLIQERARTVIQEKIGVAAIRDVEIKVEEIIKDKDAKVQELAPQPPTGEVP